MLIIYNKCIYFLNIEQLQQCNQHKPPPTTPQSSFSNKTIKINPSKKKSLPIVFYYHIVADIVFLIFFLKNKLFYYFCGKNRQKFYTYKYITN